MNENFPWKAAVKQAYTYEEVTSGVGMDANWTKVVFLLECGIPVLIEAKKEKKRGVQANEGGTVTVPHATKGSDGIAPENETSEPAGTGGAGPDSDGTASRLREASDTGGTNPGTTDPSEKASGSGKRRG